MDEDSNFKINNWYCISELFDWGNSFLNQILFEFKKVKKKLPWNIKYLNLRKENKLFLN